MSSPLFRVISNKEHSELRGIQQEYGKMIDSETRRLGLKKNSIENQQLNSERMIQLNQSYQLKQRKYLFLIMTFVVMFAACAVVVFVQSRLGIKKTTLDLILSVIVAVSLISAYFIYDDIVSRDNMDFSKLRVNHPGMLDPASLRDSVQDINAESQKEGKITSVSNEVACYGPSCCDKNTTTWSDELKRCKPKE